MPPSSIILSWCLNMNNSKSSALDAVLSAFSLTSLKLFSMSNCFCETLPLLGLGIPSKCGISYSLM